MAYQLIQRGIAPENIFYIDIKFLPFDVVCDYHHLEGLLDVYHSKMNPSGKVWLFLDEIQNIKDWEHFVNSHAQDFAISYEIFISGSNSKMLSGELATLLSGRYINFEILPFSFAEFIGIAKRNKDKSSYVEYMETGALPELFNLPSRETKRNYIAAVKDTVLLRDIIQMRQIKDPKLLEDVFVYLVNNASNLISITNIVHYFKRNNRKTSYDTVANYTRYMEDSYLIHRADRFDVKGKETIAGNSKYYINDLSFKNELYPGFGYAVEYKL